MNGPRQFAPPDGCPRCGTGTVINLSTHNGGPAYMCARCGRDLQPKRDVVVVDVRERGEGER